MFQTKTRKQKCVKNGLHLEETTKKEEKNIYVHYILKNGGRLRSQHELYG